MNKENLETRHLSWLELQHIIVKFNSLIFYTDRELQERKRKRKRKRGQ